MSEEKNPIPEHLRHAGRKEINEYLKTLKQKPTKPQGGKE